MTEPGPNFVPAPSHQAARAPAPPPESKEVKAKPPHVDTGRDHFESILFALVLALLFRTFEAEAFVIPTGSMAPTLYGRHKEATCTECGHAILIGASDEVDRETQLLNPGQRIDVAVCPNCRAHNAVEDAPAFNGDRILVNKYPYELGNPDRWDVFVFKCPAEPQTNYIKRLVGLPGETLRIRQGNIYQWDGQAEKILRKDDPEKQRVLQIPVYNDQFPPRAILANGWPERWASVAAQEESLLPAQWVEAPGWVRTEDRQYQLAATSKLTWLRYRHFTPTYFEWESVSKEPLVNTQIDPRPKLITDFCGYNTYQPQQNQPPHHIFSEAAFWTGDLTVSGQLVIESVGSEARFVLDLIEGGRGYQCRIDPATAKATLWRVTGDREQELASATCPVTGPGAYDFRFANVDDRLVLWINDRVVEFGPAAIFDEPNALTAPLPTDHDLAPIGIAAQGMTATVSELLIERDIYYRGDRPDLPHEELQFRSKLGQYLERPDQWSQAYQQQSASLDAREFLIPADGYLALGDNSPRSSDSRYWDPKLQTVARKLLIGKAFFIYWPHGVPFMNNGRGYPLLNHQSVTGERVEGYPKYSFPLYPQVDRMKRIR